MKQTLGDQIEFFRQFRQRFKTTGAIAPSSRFLARAMTGPFQKRNGPSRILEVGPGTGAVTRRIVRLLKPEDRLDLVEVNENFSSLLEKRFAEDGRFRRVAEQSKIYTCPLEEFEGRGQYDYIISGLPLNNFTPEMVREIFDGYFRLLAPEGVLSYFEYMYVRPFRKVVAKGNEQTRLVELDKLLKSYLADHRFRTSWVFVNLPPAWGQHLHRKSKKAGSTEVFQDSASQ